MIQSKFKMRKMICMGLLALLAVSCGKKGGSNQTSGDGNGGAASGVFSVNDTTSFYNDHVIYSNVEESLIHYSDCESGIDVVFCNKPECKHNNPATCASAYLADMTQGTPVVEKNGLLYFLGHGNGQENDNSMNRYLYRSNTDGSNTESIACYKYLNGINHQLYSDDYFFLTYGNQDEIIERVDENGTVSFTIGGSLNPYEVGIYLTKLSDGVTKVVYSRDDWYNLEINNLTYFDNTLYFSLSGYDEDVFAEYEATGDWEQLSNNWEKLVEHSQSALIRLDLETLEAEELCGREVQIDGIATHYAFQFQKDDPASESRTLYIWDLLSGEKKEIASGIVDFEESNGENAVIREINQSENGLKMSYLLLDMESGEITQRVDLNDDKIFALNSYVGDMLFVYIYNDDGSLSNGYISVNDLFAGNVDKLVKYK